MRSFSRRVQNILQFLPNLSLKYVHLGEVGYNYVKYNISVYYVLNEEKVSTSN